MLVCTSNNIITYKNIFKSIIKNLTLLKKIVQSMDTKITHKVVSKHVKMVSLTNNLINT